ncbi:hypothetical protein H70357_16085 [Paenibacillus sp. FSL H7-0357]|uniref:hypothetical protein n=1 Tax=Paenibacillus sp. FSL H7-0357 TaxID=1536774 RepID=UPI0004F70127|nr:hypothetical protein [Paenibacillus sp. FSL H7-0357]AIQ18025.1 hypothetical protein H70357_16085 [Paenibacillus sp. FSL H7-0357]
MTKRKWKYCGIIVFIVLITTSGWLWYSHSRQEVRLSGEAAERKELEESLRAKDKQIDFYFRKVNELIQTSENQLVWDVLESDEYKAVLAKYIKHYGIIDEYDIPKTETLGGFRYKVDESITEDYDLLPEYYGWTNVLMSLQTKDFEVTDALFRENFNDAIPTEEIYGTMEELIDIVNISVKEGRDLLPEYYRY